MSGGVKDPQVSGLERKNHTVQRKSLKTFRKLQKCCSRPLWKLKSGSSKTNPLLETKGARSRRPGQDYNPSVGPVSAPWCKEEHAEHSQSKMTSSRTLVWTRLTEPTDFMTGLSVWHLLVGPVTVQHREAFLFEESSARSCRDDVTVGYLCSAALKFSLDSGWSVDRFRNVLNSFHWFWGFFGLFVQTFLGCCPKMATTVSFVHILLFHLKEKQHYVKSMCTGVDSNQNKKYQL